MEPRQLLTGFTAYNGLFSSGVTHPNATFYSDIGAQEASGPLKDIATGLETSVLITATAVGVNFGGNGVNPAAGTDAYAIFDGKLDFSAGAEKSIEIDGTDTYQYLFENLDPGGTYEFAGTAVRGNGGYTNRWTLVEIHGADSVTPAHSSGTGVVTSGLPANQVAIWTGDNSAVGQGYVAQWLDIDPGADGAFVVTSRQYTGAVPTVINSSGFADGSKGYGLAGIRLIENVPAGPPAVENVAATDVMAFEAVVGGNVLTTGGEVPDVTVYYGTVDGGTNAGAWQSSIDIGKTSRDFTTVLDALAEGTTYYYRAFAENSLGQDWAAESLSFRTLSASRPSLEVDSVTQAGAFSAWLTGRVTDTGNDTPLVTLFYGDNDGGTNPASWDHSLSLGLQSGEFAAAAVGLQPNSTYYFTATAQNSLGSAWVTNSVRFDTTDIPPLQINEIMADNATSLRTRVRTTPSASFLGDQLTPDWIELFNPTPTVTDLTGFHLTDDADEPTQWQFPAGTLIPAGGYLVVFASGLNIRDTRLDERGYLHTNFQLDGSGGDQLILTDADGKAVFSLLDIPLQSEDISYGLDRVGEPRFYAAATPGRDNADDTPESPTIDTPSRTFTGTLVVELIPAAANHTIRYTLNEQVPTISSLRYDGPLTISATTQLRAISVGPNGKISPVVSETYVLMDQSVLDDNSNLPYLIVETFGDSVPGTGSPFGDVFIALIEPGDDGRTRLSSDFDLTTRGGIHVRGSSSSGFAKKQYRVEFWDEQNEDRKQEVLGMPKEADWIFYGPGQYDRVLISNPFMFDLSNQMGRYATRTRWVEMYLNTGGSLSASDYVGLYAITETIEQGDDRVDVEELTSGAAGQPVSGGFVWKNDRGSPYVDPELPTSAQSRYIDGVINGLRTAAAAANSTDPLRGYAAHADVPSFVDHNLLNMLAMNVDALRLSSFYFKTADGKLEAGPIWDFDRSLDSTDGRDNNPRAWFGTGDSTRYFDDNDRVMSWWPDMFEDPDFVQQYIDRWFELRANELSLDNINATIDRHAAEVSEAAARDYGRWSRSRYGDFAGEINHLKSWLRDRIEWIDSRWLSAPTFDVKTPQVTPGTAVRLSATTGQVYYTLDGTDPRGDNGTVAPGALLANGPIVVNGFTTITTRVYRAGHGGSQGYAATGDDWSAPNVGVYYIDAPADGDNLAISEVHYNPAQPSDAERSAGFNDNDSFEFIELVNRSNENLVLTGARLVQAQANDDDEGVAFDFSRSPISTLAPGERIVVVEDVDAFRWRYGSEIPVAGQWSGSLSNSGEQLTLVSYRGEVIQQFSYNDSGYWPERADGRGSSLEAINLSGDPNDDRTWRASIEYGGTPGRAPSAEVGIVINEIIAHTDPPLTPPDSIELFNVSNDVIDLSGWYLSDDADNLLKFQIPVGTLLPPGQYLVFDESHFNPNPLNPGPNDFGLSSARGDDVWLTIADSNGKVLKFVDDVHFPATPNGESMGRLPNGTGGLVPLMEVTLGRQNALPRVGPVLISELNYAPAAPNIQALVLDPNLKRDDLEYIEIFNGSPLAVDLTEWRVRGGVDLDFDPGTRIQAGETLLLISFNPDKPENINRTAAFRAHYELSPTVRLVGGYSGQLSNSGESVRLQRPDDPPAEDPNLIPRMLEDEVAYRTDAPWPIITGDGQSLTRVDVAVAGLDPDGWLAADPSPGWTRFSVDHSAADLNADGRIDVDDVDLLCGGLADPRPEYDLNQDGRVDADDVQYLVVEILGTTAGDANVDGVFNSSDFVDVFLRGEYEDGIVGNSVWSDGDWNCDGEFDSRDFVTAFLSGAYSAASQPAAERSVVVVFEQSAGPSSRREPRTAHGDVAEFTATDSGREARRLELLARDLIFADLPDGSRHRSLERRLADDLCDDQEAA